MIHPERQRGTQALMKNPPSHETGKNQMRRPCRVAGERRAGGPSCRELQQQAGEGRSPPWVCTLHLRTPCVVSCCCSRGDPGCADDALGRQKCCSCPVPRDSPLCGDRPHGVTGDEDHWSCWHRLSIFNYLCFLVLLLLIYSLGKRQMYAIGPSPPKICRSGAVKCVSHLCLSLDLVF